MKPSVHFIQVGIFKDLLAEADKRNRQFLARYGTAKTCRTESSIHRMVGYIAECLVKRVFVPLNYSKDDAYDFEFNGATFDSKAQGTNRDPSLNGIYSVYEYQRNTKADFFIFSSVKNDFSEAWIVGFIPTGEFFRKAKLMPKGHKGKNFTYNEARYDITASDLINPFVLKEMLWEKHKEMSNEAITA